MLIKITRSRDKMREHIAKMIGIAKREDGTSALEYLLVSAMLVACFWFAAMSLMAMINWLYGYWTTILVSPII